MYKNNDIVALQISTLIYLGDCMKFRYVLVGILPFMSVLIVDSHSASSGWIDANELKRFSWRVLRKGHIPTAIQCKNKNIAKGMNRVNTWVKVSYKPNPSKQKWTWAWGNFVGAIHVKRIKNGYKRVSLAGFRRPSGLRVQCAIWHKK